MKINNIAVTNLKLAALYIFTDKLVALIDKVGAEKLKIAPQFNNLLVPAFNKLKDAYKKEKKSGFTRKIKEFDKLRDDIVYSIRLIIKAALKNTDVDVREAAIGLSELFDGFKDVTKKPYNEQTADIISLLESLKGKYAESVEKVGLGKLVTELERFNKEMDSYIDVRIEEKTEKNKNDSYEAKKEISAAYRNICKMIEVYISTEGTANYEEFIRSLNTIIKEVSGSGSGKTDSDTEEEPTTPDAPVVEDKYPDAKEWHDEVRISESIEGDIYFVTFEGKKVYYKLLDRYQVSKMPGSAGTETIWEEQGE